MVELVVCMVAITVGVEAQIVIGLAKVRITSRTEGDTAILSSSSSLQGSGGVQQNMIRRSDVELVLGNKDSQQIIIQLNSDTLNLTFRFYTDNTEDGDVNKSYLNLSNYSK